MKSMSWNLATVRDKCVQQNANFGDDDGNM